VGLVEPATVVLDVGLVEDGDRVVGDRAAGERGGVDEPAPSGVDPAEARQLAVIRQRRHDRVIGGERAAPEEFDPVAVVDDPLGHAPTIVARGAGVLTRCA
jgi:hypothetical protein